MPYIDNIRRSGAMATEPKKSGKTEVLSMRMDPKTRFLVDIIAKVRGQSISTVVERAILEAADNTHIGTKSWQTFWHLNAGVREILMASEPGLFPTYEEECRLDFAKRHWQFFFVKDDFKTIKTWTVEVLWPKIDTYIDIWDRTKANDYFLAGKAMREALSDAGLVAPEWPPKAPAKTPVPPPPKPTTGGPSWEPASGDLDDEIPF
jgi:predicted transcriptional regulator